MARGPPPRVWPGPPPGPPRLRYASRSPPARSVTMTGLALLRIRLATRSTSAGLGSVLGVGGIFPIRGVGCPFRGHHLDGNVQEGGALWHSLGHLPRPGHRLIEGERAGNVAAPLDKRLRPPIGSAHHAEAAVPLSARIRNWGLRHRLWTRRNRPA